MVTVEEIQDRILLRELIDMVSILADQKNFQAQVQLFSENSISETVANGKTIMKLHGRNEMVDAFTEFIKDYDTVYHFNGQQQLKISGDIAKGTVYSLITLIQINNGIRVKTSVGAVYQDDYIRKDDRWYIEKRIGCFKWQDKLILQ